MQISDAIPEMERELKFFPADNTKQNILSTEQIDHYNINGFIFPLDVFDQKQINTISGYFEDMISKARKKGHDDYAINGWHRHCQGIYKLMMNPTILDYVCDIIGPNVLNLMTHLFFKDSGSNKQLSWHQDASYWPLTPSKTITVWLALDDVAENNGAMQYIPGSHLHGQIPFKYSEASENNVLDQTVKNPRAWGCKPVTVALKAGQISIHSDLLLHGSKINHSSFKRRGLTLRYMPPDVTTNDSQFARKRTAFLCRGQNIGGYWHLDEMPHVEKIPQLK